MECTIEPHRRKPRVLARIVRPIRPSGNHSNQSRSPKSPMSAHRALWVGSGRSALDVTVNDPALRPLSSSSAEVGKVRGRTASMRLALSADDVDA